MATKADLGRRASALKFIHAAKKTIDMDDDVYLALKVRVTGVQSAADMNNRELDLVIAELKRLGGDALKPKSSPAQSKPEVRAELQPMVNKIGALLADAKRPWGYANEVSHKVAKCTAIRFCDAEGLRKVIAALQIDADRRAAREAK